MQKSLQATSFFVDRNEDQTWGQLMAFLAAHAFNDARAFTPEHERAAREMLHYDIPRHITDSSRIQRWLRANAKNTICRYSLFE